MKLRAMVFDDDPVIRQLLETVCARCGYEVHAFAHPGLCPFAAEGPCPCESGVFCADIIISDLDMPFVKGLDFVEAQREKGCRCPHIALVSGAWTERDIKRANALGCKLFAKPFHMSQITAWLSLVGGQLSPDRTLHDLPSSGTTPLVEE